MSKLNVKEKAPPRKWVSKFMSARRVSAVGMRITAIIGMLLLFVSFVAQAGAQEPRPTPTTDSGYPGQPSATPTATIAVVVTVEPVATNTPPASTSPGTANQTGQRGTIQGVVYEDVNGDGRCVDTGVAGEGPVAGVAIQFVSDDGQTVLELTTGPEGIYGLVAAGQSNWAVTAKPDGNWLVTSAATLYAPIFEDGSLAATGVNFCVQRVTAVTVVLPDSGADTPSAALLAIAALGILLIAVGLVGQLRKTT